MGLAQNIDLVIELIDDITFATSSAQLDFLTLVEAGVRPPIAFRTKSHLDQWINRHSLDVRTVGKRRPHNTRVLIGKIHTPMGRLHYRQMWVRAKYGDYRKAMVQYLQHTDGASVKVDRHDVDHAVSSTYLLKHWPDAWVNVLFVESGINRSVGSMMEKILRPPTNDTIFLNVECTIKLFLERKEKLSRLNARAYFTDASSRFLDDATSINNSTYSDNARDILNIISRDFESDFDVRPGTQEAP